MTEHPTTRELLELAAAELTDLDRVTHGDLAEAAAVKSHLAGCARCATEYERVRDASFVLRDAASEPPAELRERTLAFVRALGRDRSAMGPAAVAAASAAAPYGRSTEAGPWRRDRYRRASLWVASLTAAIVSSVIGTSLLLGPGRSDRLAPEGDDLVQIIDWTARVAAAPDVRESTLRLKDGAAAGKVVFSPSTRELVVFTDALTAPEAGREYRCWIKVGGRRVPVGKMQFDAGLAYWFGDDVAALGEIREVTEFGISLVDVTAGSAELETVLTARLANSE